MSSSNMSMINPKAEKLARSFPRFCLTAGACPETNLETYLRAIQSCSKDSYETESAVKCVSVGEHTIIAGLENGKMFLLRYGKSVILGEEGSTK